MSTNSNLLELSIKQDCTLVRNDRVTKRLIELVIDAPNETKSSVRLPLNLSLVIDRSGSMGGLKLEFVKRAACHVLDCLTERDQVSIYAFDNEIQTVATCTLVTAAQRNMLKSKVNSVCAGGNTNLFDGWLHGVNEVATHPMPNAIQRCLLLTDGQANSGETRQEHLEMHARELRMRGIGTSTFGVGSDFNQYLLEGMATNGGGQYYFIEDPVVIPQIFKQELGDLLSVTARRAVMKIISPAGTSISLLGDIPHESIARNIIAPIGELTSNSQKLFYLEVLMPPQETGDSTFSIDISYLDANGETVAVTKSAVFMYADSRKVDSVSRDISLRSRVAELRISSAESASLKLMEAGEPAQAAAVMSKAVERNAPYIPAPRAAELSSFAEKVAACAVSPVESKTIHEESYKRRFSRK